MNNKAESSLYRKQALENAGLQSFGGILIKQPISLSMLTVLLMAISLIILGFLSYGEYARKVTVSGFLEPKDGISRVYAAKSGIIEKILVSEGDIVNKGQPLLWIKVPNLLVDGKEAHKQMLSELYAQIDELVLAIDRENEKYVLDKDWLHKKLASLRKEEKQSATIQALQRSRSKIAARQKRSIAQLKRKNFVSNYQSLQIEADFINEEKERVQLARRMTQIESEISTAEHRVNLQPSIHKGILKGLNTELSLLNQRITEVQTQSEYLINAPVAGRITASNAKVGEPVSAAKPILAILPQPAQLYAWLLIPSRAAGFVNRGQDVRLMFDSFPYQQFGTQVATIISMSQAVVNPRDINGPTLTSEPVFIAKAKLKKETISAFGQEQPLQAEMMLTADIIQSKRSILDWMLEPLYTLRGRT